MDAISAPSGESNAISIPTIPATVVEIVNNLSAVVRIDGSELDTPAIMTVAANEGDRVWIQIDAYHVAHIIANITRPPNRSVEVLGAGVDKDGNEFIELVPGQDDGGNTGSGSRLRLTNVDGQLFINGLLMMNFESGAKNTTMPIITVHEALSVENELMASWIALGNKAKIRMGEVSVSRSTKAYYEISIDEDTDELTINPVRRQIDSEGYFVTDENGDWVEVRDETSISISSAGVKIKAPRVDINGKLYVSGKEVS